MKLTRKEYTSREEKRKDFWIGVGVFIGLNVLIYVLLLLLTWVLTTLPLSPGDEESILLGLSYLAFPLQILVNIGAIIYFALTRSWVALGMLGTFGFLILLALVAGVIFSIICFTTFGGQL